MLTKDETTALETFAQSNGRYWKSILRNLWEKAAASPELMSVRNKIGPSGLAKYRPPHFKLPPPTSRIIHNERKSKMTSVSNITSIEDIIQNYIGDFHPMHRGNERSIEIGGKLPCSILKSLQLDGAEVLEYTQKGITSTVVRY